MRDSYLEFIEKGYITKDQLFKFGIDNLIISPVDKGINEWNDLKNRIIRNQKVYIRGFGRNGSQSNLYTNFYQAVLNNHNVKIDATNNSIPAKLITKLTNHSKSPNKKFSLIKNYQVSHVFGRTKNVYCFAAPWNIVYIPKIIDPLTGHEASGDLVNEFTQLFQQTIFQKFEEQINDYNQIMSNSEFLDKKAKYFDEMDGTTQNKVKIKSSVNQEFSQIEIKK